MSPLFVVVLFNTTQVSSLGHAASPGKTLHAAVLHGDGVEKAKSGAYSAGRFCRSEFNNCFVSNGNRLAAFSTWKKIPTGIKERLMLKATRKFGGRGGPTKLAIHLKYGLDR